MLQRKCCFANPWPIRISSVSLKTSKVKYLGVRLRSCQTVTCLSWRSPTESCRVCCLALPSAGCPGTFWSSGGSTWLFLRTRRGQTPCGSPPPGPWPPSGGRSATSWLTSWGPGGEGALVRGTRALCGSQRAGHRNHRGPWGEAATLLERHQDEDVSEAFMGKQQAVCETLQLCWWCNLLRVHPLFFMGPTKDLSFKGQT